MQTYHEPAHDIPITREADVIIIGGGPAGLAAGIAAARNGANTVLVERFAYLGGTATASLMASINAFRNQVEPNSTQTVRGIAEEIILKLKALNGLGKTPYEQKEYPTESGQLGYAYTVDTEKLKFVTLKMAVEAGMDLLFHTFFCDVIVEGGAIRGVIVENKSGRQALLAKVVIDASGDADVAARAGVLFWQTKKDEAPRLGDNLMYRIEFGSQRPKGTYSCDFGTNAVVWGPSVPLMNGANGDELSRAEVEARLHVYDDFAVKQAETSELADARVVDTPPLIGIRQTRFIEGEYKLTADDAISGRHFEDAIAIASNPITGYYGYRRYLEHEGFYIPYRCLIPKKIENLLVAGRCISCEQPAYDSFRAMASIMAIGQAVGTAAALCCQTGNTPRKLEVKLLQKLLVEQGAVVRR